LFVDDEQSIVNLGVQALERLGYKITGKTSSREALNIFQSQPGQFNLVITDLTMPDMTGIELAKKLLQIRPDIPIIICTGFRDKITPEKAKAMGIREFIKKPFGPRDLAETVRRVLDST
jgi:two-component system cell cycle sensor histidine kinase/response regulator CckA